MIISLVSGVSRLFFFLRKLRIFFLGKLSVKKKIENVRHATCTFFWDATYA